MSQDWPNFGDIEIAIRRCWSAMRHPALPLGTSGRSWSSAGVRLYSGDRMMQALHLLIVVGGST
jgi:hypothetical protein